jgi:hypothetical protein
LAAAAGFPLNRKESPSGQKRPGIRMQEPPGFLPNRRIPGKPERWVGPARSEVDCPGPVRSEFDRFEVDWSGAGCSGVGCLGPVRSGFDRFEVDWSEVDWSEVDWSEVDWSEVDWSEVDCSEVDWSEVDWSEVDCSEVDCSEVDCSEVDCSEVDCLGPERTGVRLSYPPEPGPGPGKPARKKEAGPGVSLEPL